MFNNGDVVKLKGYEKSYTVKVSGEGCDEECFSGSIIDSEWSEHEFNGSVSAGVYADDFIYDSFEIV